MRIYNTELVYPMLAISLDSRGDAAKYASASRRRQARRTYQKYSELFKGAEPPQSVQKSGNHFRNLTELPPLFYIICLAVMFMGRTDVNFIVLACSYVALRVRHSLIHLTVTKVPPRFLPQVTSFS